MTQNLWQVERLDLPGYLERLGVSASSPGLDTLHMLHEAHVRRFTFDNIDVLLGRHPGVDLEAVQEKFIGRGRGGYCFEHTTLFAAALERLGYDVTRHLGRVGDPRRDRPGSRTHMSVEVRWEGHSWMCDPGFGMSLLRPIRMQDAAEDSYRGRHFRMEQRDGTWHLSRRQQDGWTVMHVTDDLPVVPADLVVGHHYTSTHPASHFTRTLVVCRHLPDRHVTVTQDALTVRHEAGGTEHRPLADGELADWLSVLQPGITDEERTRLLSRAAELAHAASSAR